MSRAALTTLALSFTCILHACGAATDEGPASSTDALGATADTTDDTAPAPSDQDRDASRPDEPSDSGLPAEPPVNADPETGDVREGFCPLYADAGCPEECTNLIAGVVDPVQECHRGQRLVDCMAPNTASPGEAGCYVPPDGLAYLTAGLYRPAGPSRECTDEEWELSRSGLPECE